jgi:cytochrome c oxidase subunit 2
MKQMADINAIRQGKAKKEGRVEKPVDFDYILLCNKICGNSHYNMQLTIIVDTEADYKRWIDKQKPFFSAETAEAAVAPSVIAETK